MKIREWRRSAAGHSRPSLVCRGSHLEACEPRSTVPRGRGRRVGGAVAKRQRHHRLNPSCSATSRRSTSTHQLVHLCSAPRRSFRCLLRNKGAARGAWGRNKTHTLTLERRTVGAVSRGACCFCFFFCCCAAQPGRD